MTDNNHAPLAAETLGAVLGIQLDTNVEQLKNAFRAAQAIRVQNAAELRQRLIAEVVIRPNDQPNDQGWIKALCPRYDEHTNADETGAYVRLDGDQVAFKCHHSHGDQYRTRQFLDDISKAKEHLPEYSVILVDQTDNEFSWGEPDWVLITSERGPIPPVPLDTLPSVCAEWVQRTARSSGAPEGYVLLGLLTAGAASAGRSVEVTVGGNWVEPLVVWGMLVGNPSSGKSPALKAARRALEVIEKSLSEQNEAAWRRYDFEKLGHTMAKQAKKTAPKSKLDGLPAIPPEPTPPPNLQLIIGNATIEGTVKALGANPRGLLSFHDELASLLLNLARYSTGNDRPLYLEAWAAARWIINRVSYERPLEIPSASLSMIGGIQPEKLQELLAKDPDDGLAARFLYAWPDPPTRIPLYQRSAPDDGAMSTAMLRLWQIAASPASPLRLAIDPHDYDPLHAQLHSLQARQTDYLAGFVGKGNGTVIRLAGILTLLEWATGPSGMTPPRTVSNAALSGAFRLWHDYFLHHARACLRPGQRSGYEQKLRRVLQYLREHRITHVGRSDVREKALGRTLPANEVKPILTELVRRGWLRQVPRAVNGPGRPSDNWEVNPRLLPTPPAGNTDNSENHASPG